MDKPTRWKIEGRAASCLLAKLTRAPLARGRIWARWSHSIGVRQFFGRFRPNGLSNCSTPLPVWSLPVRGWRLWRGWRRKWEKRETTRLDLSRTKTEPEPSWNARRNSLFFSWNVLNSGPHLRPYWMTQLSVSLSSCLLVLTHSPQPVPYETLQSINAN